MKRTLAVILAVLLVMSLSGCEEKIEDAGTGTPGGEQGMRLPDTGVPGGESAPPEGLSPHGGATPGMPPGMGQSTGQPRREVVVPELVSKRWTASRIRIARKDAPEEGKVYDVAADESIQVDDSRLKVTVGQYLPDFFMDDQMVSSKGEEPNNPTVRLTVYDGEEVIYTGWAFEKYPEMHAFVHPEYTISLVGGVEKE